MKTARYGNQAISNLIGEISRPFFQKQGLIDERLVFYWAQIVGDKLAQYSFPIKLVGQQGQVNSPRILEVLVNPGAALEITYAKNSIVAKINQFFGFALISDIRLKHGQIQKNDKKLPERPKRTLNIHENEHIQSLVTSIQDENLRNALKNLGKALLSQQKENVRK
ncbi:MAG: DciA family protein [Alphaproteobacteria bacterium]|nr:DciA family protein [Alphaproteobacteria bacterium]